MTREEAIEELTNALDYIERSGDKSCVLSKETIELAMSALSAQGEYIKKEDTIKYLNDLFGEMHHVSFGDVLQSVDSLQTYSFPESAENKGDLISRQAVLDTWHTSYSDNREENEEIQYKKIAFELPSAENKGEWISTEDRPFGFCSKCDKDIDEAATPYCPYCGAKMTWVGAIHEPYKKGE